MSIVIRVENLSKYYRLGEIGGGTLREDLNRWWARVRGRPDPWLKVGETDHGNRKGDEIWALRDVSFEVWEGEILGVIGRNGAGKSTLLKILSRITAPTSGRALIKGRVGSLLEVGTGFHPELTGRENIYLNGTILGMTKAEVDRKLEEIVEFAEMAPFIDTPVKRYSSGMTVRLAFAVAAHLEPEVLIIDEVLAVGDAAFQKKCLGKMQDVSSQGRTVLFVSHNMGAVSSLCQDGILLSEGRLLSQGQIDEIVGKYLGGDGSNKIRYLAGQPKKTPYIKEVSIEPHDKSFSIFHVDRPISIDISIEGHNKKYLVLGLIIKNASGVCVHHVSNEFEKNYDGSVFTRKRCIIPAYALAAGKYFVEVNLTQRAIAIYEVLENALVFEVEFTGPMSKLTRGHDWKGTCGPGLIQWT